MCPKNSHLKCRLPYFTIFKNADKTKGTVVSHMLLIKKFPCISDKILFYTDSVHKKIKSFLYILLTHANCLLVISTQLCNLSNNTVIKYSMYLGVTAGYCRLTIQI